MTYLLDTNAISDVVRQHPAVERRLRAAMASGTVVTSVVAVGELLHGIDRLAPGVKQDTLRKGVGQILSAVPIEGIPATAAPEFARIKIQRQQVGRPMDHNDLWIAAHALILGATLVTRDADFSGIAGLSAEDWSV